MAPGESFGEMALISRERRTATLKTVTHTQCIRMAQKDFSDLLDKDAGFAQRMMRILTDRLKEADEAAVRDVVSAQQALIFSLAKLAESRDPETGARVEPSSTPI